MTRMSAYNKSAPWPEMLFLTFGMISWCARLDEVKNTQRKKIVRQEKGNRGEENKEKGIFTYTERRWVVPSSNGSRHTGDM